jgi:hypothetical protein
MPSPFGIQKNWPKANALRANYARICSIKHSGYNPMKFEKCRNALGELAEESGRTLKPLREGIGEVMSRVAQ